MAEMGAYPALIEHAAAVLVFESADGFTPAEARVLADLVLKDALPRLADALRDTWRNGGDAEFHALARAADYVETLPASGDYGSRP